MKTGDSGRSIASWRGAAKADGQALTLCAEWMKMGKNGYLS